MTTSPRRPRNASASWRSARPFPYASAASKNVMPCSSSARRSMSTASASVLSPHQPVEMVHVPNPTSLTRMSVPGKVLYFMKDLLGNGSSVLRLIGSRRASGRRDVPRPAVNRKTDKPKNSGISHQSRRLCSEIRDDHVRPRAANAEEALHHHALAVDPAAFGRCLNH